MCVVFVSALCLLTARLEICYGVDSIKIVAKLKKGTFIESNLYFQDANSTFTFGGINTLCPSNMCKYEFKDGTFFNSLLDVREKYLAGTLTVLENKNGSLSSLFYKLSGTMTQVGTKENIKTGEKINTYEGLLGIDKQDPIIDPKIKYESEIVYNEYTQAFSLIGHRETR